MRVDFHGPKNAGGSDVDPRSILDLFSYLPAPTASRPRTAPSPPRTDASGVRGSADACFGVGSGTARSYRHFRPTEPIFSVPSSAPGNPSTHSGIRRTAPRIFGKQYGIGWNRGLHIAGHMMDKETTAVFRPMEGASSPFPHRRQRHHPTAALASSPGC